MLILPFTVFLTTTLSLLAMARAERMTTGWSALEGNVALQLSHNEGIAFGMTIPSPWQERIIVAAIIIVIALAYMDRESTNKLFAYGLILGGAFGNLIDRVIDGVVTDFIRIAWFPVFNIADTAITIGVMVLIIEIFFDE